MPDRIEQAKRALRADLRERRQIVSSQTRDAAEAGVKEQLDALVDRLGARSISCFLSTPTEPGTHAFVTAAVARGIRVLLPITREDGLLDWSVATPETEIAEGLFGLPEPVGDVLGPIAVNDVDLLVIPAAAGRPTRDAPGLGTRLLRQDPGLDGEVPAGVRGDLRLGIRRRCARDVHDQPVTGVVTPTRTIALASHHA